MNKCCGWTQVERQTTAAMAIWDASSGPWTGGLRFNAAEQKRREEAYDDGLRTVEREARKVSRSLVDKLETQRRIVGVFPRFAAIALGLEDEAVDLLTNGFLPAATELGRWARRFDPELSTADLVQACRNAWTACGLQSLMGEEMRLTPSILGYSMLYPLSDNYLDSDGVTRAEKLEFSARFRERLMGNSLPTRGSHEASVWAMVDLIETEYPRAEFERVYEGLLAIHRAQELSVAQQRCGSELCGEELLRISFAKGGTSVLADACLVRGWLSEEEGRLAFEWGALLQLGDDLQDVREDLRNGSESLFSRAAARGDPLDDLVMQLLNLSERVTERMQEMPSGSAALKGLLQMSWRNLILMAVANGQEFFSRSMLRELETSSPFRFGFLRKRGRKLLGRKGLYEALIDAFLAAGDGDLERLPLAEHSGARIGSQLKMSKPHFVEV